MTSFETIHLNDGRGPGESREVANLCAHNCYRCGTFEHYSRNGFMYANVRCPDCGHSWLHEESFCGGTLPKCADCRSLIYSCDHCMYRIGVQRPRGFWGAPSEHRWCRDCWIGWLANEFQRANPQKVLTLTVTTHGEIEGFMTVTCTGVDGSEVLREGGVTGLCVGDVIQKLGAVLGFDEEFRLMPNGRFYSLRAVEAWASSLEGGIHPRLEPRHLKGIILERSTSCRRSGARTPEDVKRLDESDKSEAHWQNVWATAPKLSQQVCLCTPDGRVLTMADKNVMLESLSQISL